MSMLVYALLLVLQLTLSVCQEGIYDQAAPMVIYVDEDSGKNDSSCWHGGKEEPCSSLGLALEGMQHFNHTTVWVTAGSYALGGRGNSMEYLYMWMTDLSVAALPGNYEEEAFPVRVECEEGVGLTFIYVTNVTISRIELTGCGAYHYSTSRNSSSSPFEKFYVALYFLYSSDVTLESISVTNSTGTGVVMYATVGTNRVANSTFSLNSPAGLGYSGGGGLYIEFPYCVPILSDEAIENCSSNVPLHYVSNSNFTIEFCSFLANDATILDDTEYTFILPHLETHLAFGRGAGMSIFFKGNSGNNIISVRNSTFANNTALWGAGLFVEHQDMSHNNTFIMESSVIENNSCYHSTSENQGTGGGGVRIGHIFFENTHASHNVFIFRDVTFNKNLAYYGGGLSFYTAKEPTESTATNTVEFYECKWTHNVARVGSGVDMSMWHPVPYGAIAEPSFTNCTFSENTARYTSVLGSAEGIGAFYSDFIPISFFGFVKFESNNQTALACIGSRIQFRSNCVADFKNNSGRNGGAVALMGGSFIEVSQGTVLNFVGNEAELKGGAIFGYYIGGHDLISSRNCFIRYFDIEVTPFDWNVTFNLINNTANSKKNSIYATSLLMCYWGGAYGSTEHGAQDVFCWNRNDSFPKHWIYSGNCSDEIATSPAIFKLRESSSNDTMDNATISVRMSVIPGHKTYLPFYTKDDRGNDVTNETVFTAKVINETNERIIHIDSSSLYIADNFIDIHGTPGKSANIKLQTIDPRVISTQITVDMLHCPPGMIFNDSAGESGSRCVCRGDYGGLILCHSVLFYSELQRGSWIGIQNDTSSDFVVGQCPYCSLFTNDRTLALPPDVSQHMSVQCESINRTGVLCGQCLPGYGPVVNGFAFECHKCSPSEAKHNWVFYLLTEFLPILIFFLVVLFFNVSVSSGPANAFVFFAQVLTTVFEVDGDGSIQLNNITNSSYTSYVLKAIYIVPYDIWNQNFFHPLLPKFCLSSEISTLQLQSTGYVTAFFPLLLVVFSSLLVWAYGRGFVPIVFVCRPVHKCFARTRQIGNFQRSIIDALATFILLSYTKFTLVSFILLTSTPLSNDMGEVVSYVLYYDGTITYLGHDHIPYIIVSVIVLATFVALPPLILIGPSVIHLMKQAYKKITSKDLKLPACCNPGPILDQFLVAFHGCYKDGTGGPDSDNKIDCRWFAGFYFLLRLVLFLNFAFTGDWFLQHVLQQLICIATLLTFVIFRPYKNHLFNIVDTCIFANLTAISSLSMYNYYLTVIGSTISAVAFAIQYILIFLPLIYMIVYVSFLIWRKCSKLDWFKKTGPPSANQDDEQFLEYADEAERYRNICGSYQKRLSTNTARRDKHSVVVEDVDETRSLQEAHNSPSSADYGATSRTTHTNRSTSSSNQPSQNAHTSTAGKTEAPGVTENSLLNTVV